MFSCYIVLYIYKLLPIWRHPMNQHVIKYQNHFIRSLVTRARVKGMLALFCTLIFHLIYYRYHTASFLQLGIPMLGVSFLCSYVSCYKIFSIPNRYWQFLVSLPLISIALGYQYTWMCQTWIPHHTSFFQTVAVLSALLYVLLACVKNKHRFLSRLQSGILSFSCAYTIAWCLPLLTALPKEWLQDVEKWTTILSYQGAWVFGLFLLCYVGIFRNRFSFSAGLLTFGILVLTLYQLDTNERKQTIFWQDMLHQLDSGAVLTGIFAIFLLFISVPKIKVYKKTS